MPALLPGGLNVRIDARRVEAVPAHQCLDSVAWAVNSKWLAAEQADACLFRRQCIVPLLLVVLLESLSPDLLLLLEPLSLLLEFLSLSLLALLLLRLLEPLSLLALVSSDRAYWLLCCIFLSSCATTQLLRIKPSSCACCVARTSCTHDMASCM